MQYRLVSVRLLIGNAGNIVNRYTYTPFGEMFTSECSEPISNPFKFTGQWYDSEIDQYYLRARMYDPYLGRFTSLDPIRGRFVEPLTLHKYLYCNNDPINNTDPSGEFLDFFIDAYLREKDTVASYGFLGWAKNEIGMAATLSNAFISGWMNVWCGPESISDKTKFGIGFTSGAL
jgi:RHS repeat-associated protein